MKNNNSMVISKQGHLQDFSKNIPTTAMLNTIPTVIDSVAKIVESNKEKKVKMLEITECSKLENNRINKEYQDKCNNWAFRNNVMMSAFESDKISGEQIIALAKEFIK